MVRLFDVFQRKKCEVLAPFAMSISHIFEQYTHFSDLLNMLRLASILLLSISGFYYFTITHACNEHTCVTMSLSLPGKHYVHSISLNAIAKTLLSYV